MAYPWNLSATFFNIDSQEKMGEKHVRLASKNQYEFSLHIGPSPWSGFLIGLLFSNFDSEASLPQNEMAGTASQRIANHPTVKIRLA